MFVDLAVYTKNRQLRIMGSSKLGKTFSLKNGPFTTFKGGDKSLFSASLASVVPLAYNAVHFEEFKYQVQCDGAALDMKCRKITTEHVQLHAHTNNLIPIQRKTFKSSSCEAVEGSGTSMYPMLDSYVQSYLRNSVPDVKLRQVFGCHMCDDVRKWTLKSYSADHNVMTYFPTGYRYCGNVGMNMMTSS